MFIVQNAIKHTYANRRFEGNSLSLEINPALMKLTSKSAKHTTDPAIGELKHQVTGKLDLDKRNVKKTL